MNRRSDLPTTAELEIPAELWNALASRVSKRTDRMALFRTRDRAVRIAVMALDAATDEWLAGYEVRTGDVAHDPLCAIRDRFA